MTIRPAAMAAPETVRSLAVGSALLSVTTFALLLAAGSPAARAGAYAVAVPLAASTGAAVVLGLAFAGAAVGLGERVARGRFALPVTAAAAGCVLASLWLLAPSGLAPLGEQPAGRVGRPDRAAAAPVIGVPAPHGQPRRPAGASQGSVPAEGTRRTPVVAAGTVTGPVAGGPVAGPGAGPAAGPGGQPVVAPPAVEPADPVTRPRARPVPGFDRAGIDPPVTAEPGAAEHDAVATGKAKARKATPGRRCGQRADHCRTPFGRAVGYRRR